MTDIHCGNKDCVFQEIGRCTKSWIGLSDTGDSTTIRFSCSCYESCISNKHIEPTNKNSAKLEGDL